MKADFIISKYLYIDSEISAENLENFSIIVLIKKLQSKLG